MSSISEVKAALDAVAGMISSSIRQRTQIKVGLLAARNQLANLPTQHSAAITEINGYTPTGAFETLAKDELAKMTTEFLALKTALETELTALGVSYP